jgi:hypothetical protein
VCGRTLKAFHFFWPQIERHQRGFTPFSDFVRKAGIAYKPCEGVLKGL